MVKLQKLNKDQLDGLASLCLDLAKLSLAVALVPSSLTDLSYWSVMTRMLSGLVIGSGLVYLAMLLLKYKEKL